MTFRPPDSDELNRIFLWCKLKYRGESDNGDGFLLGVECGAGETSTGNKKKAFKVIPESLNPNYLVTPTGFEPVLPA